MDEPCSKFEEPALAAKFKLVDIDPTSLIWKRGAGNIAQGIAGLV
jgi:hypothetical protein